MAKRIKFINVPVDFKRSTLTFEQMIELNVNHESELKVVQFPPFPEGIKPQMSRFWNAMQKRKLYKLRRKN
jgi:hypothetical protein